jgi:hypothetical protein
MGSKKGIKRGEYKKKPIDNDLEVLTNKNAIDAQLNTLRARIRTITASMRGLRNRLRGDLKLIAEYQKFNEQLYKTKKNENALTYQRNML